METVESPTITYREALRQGLRQALLENQETFLLGEDVGRYGGAFAVSMGLREEFGEARIMDAPLSEAAFTGAGIGAAISGMRPIVEIMTVNFSLLALDQLVNNAATLRHMTNGQVKVPLIVRMSCGIGRQLAAQHSHSWEPLFAHIPGLIIQSLSSHEDARYAITAALREPDPVILMEYTSLLNTEAPRPSPPADYKLRKAKVMIDGSDITIITYGAALHRCLAAATILKKENINAAVIDLRCLRPLDNETIFTSVRKSHRVLVAEDAWQSLGMGAEIAARIQSACFFDLDAPVARLGGKEVPIPYPLALEEACIPQAERIAECVRDILHPVKQ